MERLPGVDDDPGDRIVCHVDMDCFYASCERLREPALRDEPVVVGMGYEPGDTIGAVATASYEAREYGVESAQPISEALELLPRRAGEETAEGASETTSESNATSETDAETTGYYRPVDMEYYESVAADVKAVLGELAETVREVSIDEAYLDVTERTAWDRAGPDGRPLAEGFGRHVRQRIAREVGVPASVGIAPNMSVAKVASDHDKPDGLTVVPPGEVGAFLAPLPTEAIHGVGPVRARELAEMGIETAGELAAADPATLAERFGDRGRELYERAHGRDDREVTPRGRPKSLSRESAFAAATDDRERVRDRVRALAADVAERARSRGATYRTIGIKAVEPPFEINTRAESLSGPVDDPALVERVAMALLEEFEGHALRKVGVRVSNLSFADTEQSKLGGYDAGDAASDDSADDAGRAEGARAEAAGDADPPADVAALTEWVDRETLAEWAETEGDTARAHPDRREQPSLDSFDEE